MSFFDYLTYQWTKGEKNWHIPYNNALQALKDFLGDKGTNTDLGGGLTSVQTEVTNARSGAADLQARIDPIASEQVAARGTTANLSTRLAQVINPDGTPTAGASVAVEFKASGDTPAFVSSTSFKIPTDKTAVYVKNRKVKLTLNGGDVVAAIVSSSFANPDTTVVVDVAVIDNTISAVAYGIDTPASAPKNPQVDINTDMAFRLAEQQSIDNGQALLMEIAWADSFPVADGIGADEAASVGFAYDMVSKFYKGIDGGVGFNVDFPFTTESDYLQKDFTNANQSTSQATFTNASATVTLSSGSWPTNAANMRITPDGGTTWFGILSRDSATQITLDTNFTGTTGPKDYIIRPTEFVGGKVRLNERGSGFTADLTSGKTATSNFSSGVAADVINDVTNTLGVWNNPGSTGQWTLDFGAGVTKIITQYTIIGWDANTASGFAPKDWKLQGSNDGTNFTDIDTQTGAPAWTADEKRTYNSFTNTTGYRYYRFDITASQGGSALTLHEIELMESEVFNPVNEPAVVIPVFSQLKNAASVIDINSFTTASAANQQFVKHAFIFGTNGMTSYNNTNTLVAAFNSTGGVWKKVVRWDGAKWQRNSDTTNTNAETWVDSTGAGATDIVHAISEAIDLNTAVSMTGGDVNGITDAEFEMSGGFVPGTHTWFGFVMYLKSMNNIQNPEVSLARVNWDTDRAAMDLRSKTFDPGAVPATAYVWALQEYSAGDGPGVFQVSRDGGATWTTITLAQQGSPISGNIRVMRGTLDFTTEPAAQDLRVRYQTTQGRDQFLHAWGLQARQ
ncbi:MAG: discoidin domain-containing protein [Nitrospinales bacterium]